MSKLTYLAAFEPNNCGGYGVFFPNLLGCFSKMLEIRALSYSSNDK